MVRELRLGPEICKQEAAGAIRILGRARRKAAVAEERCLLVSYDACDGRPVREDVVRHIAEVPIRRLCFRQEIHGHADKVAELLVPAELVDIEEHRARGIRIVRCMHLVRREVPDKPGIDRARKELSFFCRSTSPVHMVQDPGNLRAREVGVGDEAAPLVDHLPRPFIEELLNLRRRTAALPHDCVVDGMSCLLLPDDRGLALVCDRDGREPVRMDAGLELHLDHAGHDTRGDLFGVLLDPAWMRIEVLDRTACLPDGPAFFVEDDGTHAGRSCVERHDIAGHGLPPATGSFERTPPFS